MAKNTVKEAREALKELKKKVDDAKYREYYLNFWQEMTNQNKIESCPGYYPDTAKDDLELGTSADAVYQEIIKML